MYELWAPGPIIRMQEDACSLYSPALYRTFLQHIDRELAKSFSNAFIHLHSTSLPFLELFLEIEDLRCFEINLDVSGPAMSVMVPAFQKVQSAGRSLIIRGSFTADDLILLRDSLDAKGLMVLILVENLGQMEQLRKHVGL